MYLRAITCSFALAASAASGQDQPTNEEIVTALWAQAEAVCAAQASAYLEAFDDAFMTTIIGRLENESDPDLHHWPMSAEHKQIMTFVTIQAAQVLEVLNYHVQVEDSFEGGAFPDDAAFARARASTDLAKCLLPVGDRFATSPEPGISLLAHETTKATLCTKWYEYSDRMLNLAAAEMTPDEYTEAWISIGTETIESCEERI